MKNAVGVGNLVKSCGAFRAVSATRAGMLRIAFELLNFICRFIDVRQETARRLAIEASRRRKNVAALYTPGPGARIELSPIIPAFFGGIGSEMIAGRARVEGFRDALGAQCFTTNPIINVVSHSQLSVEITVCLSNNAVRDEDAS